MATRTSLVAQQIRIRQWAEQIRDCQNCPEGMDVETWCTQNNLTKSNYYYRLRRVRKACLAQIPNEEPQAFVELPAPMQTKPAVSKETSADALTGRLPVIRIRNASGLFAEIFPGASQRMLCSLIEAMCHVE